MSMTLQNIPFFCLLWIGIGFVFIIVGIFMIASHSESSGHYTEFSNQKLDSGHNKEVGELFSYFLEEEEKKNQGLRDILLEVTHKKGKDDKNRLVEKTITTSSNDTTHYGGQRSANYNEIIKLHEDGASVEEIAKKLKKGVGEVNLMISLYSMR